MSPAGDGLALPPDVDRQLEGAPPAEIAVSLATYNNIATVPAVADAIRAGLEKHFAGVPAVLISADAGSSDATVERLAAAGLRVVRAAHEASMVERAAVPFHGVPGRGAALRLAFAIARRLGARGLVVLEADVTSIGADWLERLLRPVLEGTADLVMPLYERHRYDGTITNLTLSNNEIQNTIDTTYLSALSSPLPNLLGQLHGQNNHWYRAGGNSSQVFQISGIDMSFDAFKVAIGDTTSTFGAVKYPDPNRTIATYHVSIGGAASHDAFIKEARKQSKSNWRPQYTADAVIAYIRAGFGR